MAVDPNLIASAADQLAKLLNKSIDELKIGRENAIFKFKAQYEEEKKRPDRDHDDIVKWAGVKRLLLEEVIEKIRPYRP